MNNRPKNDDAPPVDMRFQRWVGDSKFKPAGETRYTRPTKDLSAVTNVSARLDRKVMKGLLKNE